MTEPVKAAYIPELGKKYTIPHFNKQYRESLKYFRDEGQLETEIEKQLGKDIMKFFDAQINLDKLNMDYLQDTLKISDKELEKFDGQVKPEDFRYAAYRVAMLVQGRSEKEAEEAVNGLKSLSEQSEENDGSGEKESDQSSKK